MAYLESLKMQNVRSIGDTPHAIEFLRPLTLIQGNNGTGKTTIIEGLNFITSGSLPAGKLATFIHDPKIAQKKKVDALIMLKFKDVRGSTVVATKRMNSEIAKTIAGLKTKSDESNLKIIDKYGKEETTSTKVTDFNAVIVKHLGVSSTILENVIFCHQEESNWPLSEPKYLKEKFDKIFEVSDYVNVIDNIKSERKRLETEMKILDGQLPLFEENVNRLSRLQADYEKKKNNQKKCIEQKKELEEKLLKSSDEEKQLNEDYSGVKKKLGETKMKQVELKAKREELNGINVRDYAGTRKDLEKELSDAFNAPDVQQAEKKQAEIDKKLAGIDVESENITNQIPKLQKKLNDAEVTFQLRATTEKELADLTNKMKDFYEIDGDVVERMQMLLSEAKIRKNDHETNWNLKKKEMESEHKKVSQEYHRVVAQKETKTKEIWDLKEDLKKLTLKLEQEGDPAVRASEIEEKLAEIESKLSSGKSLKELESEVEAKSKEIIGISSEIELIEKCLQTKNDWKLKEEEFTKAVEKSKIDFDAVFEKKINKNFANEVNMLCNILDDELSTVEKYFKKVDKETGLLENEFSKLSMRIEINTKTIQNKQEQVDNCGVAASKVKSEKANVTCQLLEKRNELGQQQGCSFLYSKWEKEVEMKKCCPLCDRGYEKPDQAKKLVEKVRRMNKDLPDEISMLEKEIAQLAKKEEKLLQIYPLVEEIENLSIKLENDETTLKKKEEEKIMKKKKWEESKKKLNEIQRKIQKAKEILGDAKNLDRLLKELTAAENVYLTQKDKLSQFLESPEIDGESLATRKDDLDWKKLDLEDQLEACKDLLKMIKKMTDDCFALKEEKIRLGEFASLSRTKAEKSTVLEEKSSELEKLDEILPDLRKKVVDLEKEISKNQDENEKLRRKLTEEISSFETNFADLNRIKKKLETQVVDENVKQKLTEELKELHERKEENETKKRKLEVERNTVLSKQEQIRNLKDQKRKMDLKEKVTELQSAVAEVDTLESDEGNLVAKLRSVGKAKQKINDELKNLEGELNFLTQDLIARKQEIKKTGTNVVVEYRDKLAQRLILRHINEDLELFAKSLDDAIINYHSRKMESINANLEEHWPNVYRGTDIETIRIRSDPVSGTEKRKSYDYKVVMVVDGKELEMRDRCSAGQKVLASILIRVALADVFAVECPILALDEPTTNLDREKVENVAEMLENLLKLRQNNLQLIVITHDTDFVSRLYRACSPEFYYGLTKDEYGVSVLRRHNRMGESVDLDG